MTIQDKVDETIVAICDEIQREIKEELFDRKNISRLTEALAELLSARAKLEAAETAASIRIDSDGSSTVSADRIQITPEPDKCAHRF